MLTKGKIEISMGQYTILIPTDAQPKYIDVRAGCVKGNHCGGDQGEVEVEFQYLNVGIEITLNVTCEVAKIDWSYEL